MSPQIDNRKAEILLATAELIQQQGLAKTSTNDIAKKVGIARGTLYHHFASKEDIIDALVDQTSQQLFDQARLAAQDTTQSLSDRFWNTLAALNIESIDGEILLDHIHQKDNLILHHKVQTQMLEVLPKIFLPIIQEGIATGIFSNEAPYESLELFITYVVVVINENPLNLDQQEQAQRVLALIHNLDRLFGSQADFFMQGFLSSPFNPQEIS